MENHSAERGFREAFERLKKNSPIRVPKDTQLSQNNVAKEAGVDPSALRKSRYPTLISEIQKFIAENAKHPLKTTRQIKLQEHHRKNFFQNRIAEISAQRDQLANLLNVANERIIVLTARVAELEEKSPQSNVIALRP
jgi:hypothetical protein